MGHEQFSRRGLIRGAVLGSVAITVGTAGLDRAPHAAAAATLNYTDSFARPNSSVVGDGWLQLRGKWSIVSQTLQPTGNTAQMQIAQSAFTLGKRFTVEGKVTVNAPGGVHNGIAFNIHDRGNGNQDSYALTLMYGEPSIWALFGISNSSQHILPAFKEIDLVAGKTYTLRATARTYGSFKITILDGDTTLVAEQVDLDPFNAQLAGGFAGLYSQAGNADGTVAIHEITVQSSSKPSSPPAPPADVPLVCVKVSRPPYTLPSNDFETVNSSQVDTTQAYIAVGQGLLTRGVDQYVAYYAASQEMTVAHRTTDSASWQLQGLNNSVGTDGHNSVGMATDRDGQLHVSGNMHNVPLIYFRTSTVGDVASLQKIDSMVDPANEQSVTYPVFLYNSDGALIFNYRSGVSGNGATYYNIYDEASKTWSPLLDGALFDGQGAGNSYPSSPALGPDGYFHMLWVWRATGDAATNSNLSYARSKDLVHWETIGGTPLSLPLTQTTAGVIVDPIPMYNGLLNGVPVIGFDHDNKVLISYYKLDKSLTTQVYVARPKSGNRWSVTKITEWTGRYFAQGIGAIPAQPLISPVATLPDGNLQLSYSYTPDADTSYSGTLVLDPRTLQPITEAPVQGIVRNGTAPFPNLPAEITTVRSSFANMAVQLRADSGSSGTADEQYFLRYEASTVAVTKAPFPDPSPLQVYLVKKST